MGEKSDDYGMVVGYTAESVTEGDMVKVQVTPQLTPETLQNMQAKAVIHDEEYKLQIQDFKMTVENSHIPLAENGTLPHYISGPANRTVTLTGYIL